jgi:hypothetical protein
LILKSRLLGFAPWWKYMKVIKWHF